MVTELDTHTHQQQPRRRRASAHRAKFCRSTTDRREQSQWFHYTNGPYQTNVFHSSVQSRAGMASIVNIGRTNQSYFIVRLAIRCIAIEQVCLMAGIDRHRFIDKPSASGVATKNGHSFIRSVATAMLQQGSSSRQNTSVMCEEGGGNGGGSCRAPGIKVD